MKSKSVSKKFFPDFFLKEWEKEDGVNFAIALARVSGWLLHIDWWTPFQGAPESMMKSLRVYVGTDNDDVFDFTGKKPAEEFSENIISPIVQKRGGAFYGGVQTKYYSEDQIWKLPLRIKPNEEKILRAEELILKSTVFLKMLPKRLNPSVPAYLAASFSFGHCAVLAQALEDVKNIRAIAIVAEKYSSKYALSKLGYCHSVNIHADGQFEDSFGKQPLENILARFGIEKYNLDKNMHADIHANLKKNSPVKYEEVYARALELIRLS